MTNDDETKFWQEDAERLNKMAELARRKGKAVEVGADEPPELNEDGSLKVIEKEAK